MFKLKSLPRRPVFLGLIAFLAVAGAGGNHLTSRTSFCGSCHEMKTLHAGWAASAHAGAHCYDCHADKGAMGMIKAKAQGLRELAAHVTGRFDLAKVTAHVPAGRCTACHDMADRAKLGERIVNSHQKHLEAKLDCIVCHAVVGHTREAFGGFGAPACTPCHNAKPMARPATFIHKTPCLRKSDETSASQAAVISAPPRAATPERG